MIEARNVTKRLGDRAVVEGASLRIEPGRVLGLIGPNGAGKSTLLRLLSGELSPDAGVILIDEKNARAWRADELARRRAFLPQSPELVFDFTVRELVVLGRAAHASAETPACAAIAERAIARVGLAGRAGLPVPALSGGERQRAHLARILAQLEGPGRYVLLDEPVSSQDPAWQLRILRELRSLARAGVGVAVVLHDLNLAGRSCDELALLDAGAIVRSGSVRHVLDPAVLGRVFDVDARVDPDPFDDTVPRVSFRAAGEKE